MKGFSEWSEIDAWFEERKTLTKYFYMPIEQAAMELDMGVTSLKKRCRKVGIGRWPYRKLMSLQTLINDVQVRSLLCQLIANVLVYTNS